MHGGGGSQLGEVTFGGSPHLSCKPDLIKMRDYMDRRVTPPKRITSPTWGSPSPCKQALRKNSEKPRRGGGDGNQPSLPLLKRAGVFRAKLSPDNLPSLLLYKLRLLETTHH